MEFHYSIWIADEGPVQRPTLSQMTDLIRDLPLSQHRRIWSSDRKYSAEVNEYLVPTDDNIGLYAATPLMEKELPGELYFDCYSYGSINVRDFDFLAETLRDFETRRNEYLIHQHRAGRTTFEYGTQSSTRRFNITRLSSLDLQVSCEKAEAAPNFRVSDSFLQTFYRGTYDDYSRDKACSSDLLPNQYHFASFSSQEAFNMELVNWINRNIFDLANLGFYATNYPDVIFFGTSINGSPDMPGGTVHRANKQGSGRLVAESGPQTGGGAASGAANAAGSIKGRASSLFNDNLKKALIRMLPLLIILLILSHGSQAFIAYSGFVMILLWFVYSKVRILLLYFLCVFIYYRHLNKKTKKANGE